MEPPAGAEPLVTERRQMSAEYPVVQTAVVEQPRIQADRASAAGIFIPHAKVGSMPDDLPHRGNRLQFPPVLPGDTATGLTSTAASACCNERVHPSIVQISQAFGAE